MLFRLWLFPVSVLLSSSLHHTHHDIYEQGRQKGLKEAGVIEVSDDDHTLDLRELKKSIRAVPGMGAKRTEAVMVLTEQWMGVAD